MRTEQPIQPDELMDANQIRDRVNNFRSKYRGALRYLGEETQRAFVAQEVMETLFHLSNQGYVYSPEQIVDAYNKLRTALHLE